MTLESDHELENACFDYLIVGAGTAGCVLAGRLSETASIKVLLVEAGQDAPPAQEHRDIQDIYPVSVGNSRFRWPDLRAVHRGRSNGQEDSLRPLLQGRGVGGSSNIMGMAANRGHPDDYDEWKLTGLRNWGWQEVLPYFKKLENDWDFSGELHGEAGPLPVRRVAPSNWAPFSKAISQALTARGYPIVADCNADFRDGVTPMPMNSLPQRRVSASSAYLTRSVRTRSNFTLLANTLVERIRFNARTADGVLAVRGGRRIWIRAKHTIVACGAIHSPALLMRSGVGPAEQLRRLGVHMVHASPGIGANLLNHAEVTLACHLPRAAMQPKSQRPWQQHMLRYSSGIASCPVSDMAIITTNKGGWHALGRRVGAVRTTLYKAFSQGSVELSGADPSHPLIVRINELNDSRDFERLVHGLKFALSLLTAPQMARARNEVFLPNDTIMALSGQRRFWTKAVAWSAAGILEVPQFRRALLGASVVNLGALANDEDALREVVSQCAKPLHHLVGSCKMGAAHDRMAVLDDQCRVRGIDGISVVDASIFPTIMRANTHLPTIMAAEKVSDQIKGRMLQGGW